MSPTGACIPCQSNCKNCSTGSECNKCVDGLILLHNQCVSNCPSGYEISL